MWLISLLKGINPPRQELTMGLLIPGSPIASDTCLTDEGFELTLVKPSNNKNWTRRRQTRF